MGQNLDTSQIGCFLTRNEQDLRSTWPSILIKQRSSPGVICLRAKTRSTASITSDIVWIDGHMTHMLHGAGIFTYICPINHPVL